MTRDELKQLIDTLDSAVQEDIFYDAESWGDDGLGETISELQRVVWELSKWAKKGLPGMGIEWVSVKDRLPSHKNDVLVCKGDAVFTAYRLASSGWHVYMTNDEDGYFEADSWSIISHWAEINLPEGA